MDKTQSEPNSTTRRSSDIQSAAMPLKPLAQAQLELMRKPPLLIFPGLRQSAQIHCCDSPDCRHIGELAERSGLGNWDRYYNYGWKVRYQGRHVATSYYYPTHVLISNGNILKIGEALNKRAGPYGKSLWDFTEYLDASYQRMPDIDAFMRSSKLFGITRRGRVAGFLEWQAQERKRFGVQQ